MEMIATIATALQKVLGPIVQEAGRASGLIWRVRSFDGAGFVQMLVFGYQGQPEATLEDLVKMGATVGVQLSPQGLAQRLWGRSGGLCAARPSTGCRAGDRRDASGSAAAGAL